MLADEYGSPLLSDLGERMLMLVFAGINPYRDGESRVGVWDSYYPFKIGGPIGLE